MKTKLKHNEEDAIKKYELKISARDGYILVNSLTMDLEFYEENPETKYPEGRTACIKAIKILLDDLKRMGFEDWDDS